MEFYQDLITEKSFKILQELKRQFDFVLIGGWAVFLYTKSLKSKDIDLIIEYQNLDNLKEKFNLIKNDRLRKYEIKQQEVDIDIYLPHYSSLGLPVEEIGNYVIQREGFTVPQIEILLILKQYVFSQREGSAKGEKDRLDILSLLKTKEIRWDFYKDLLEKYRFQGFGKELATLLEGMTKAPEVGLNEYSMAKLKKEILALNYETPILPPLLR